jgi:[ribosomal protein S5]-alanine N-acetyltransferase
MDHLQTDSVLLDPLTRDDYAWLFVLYADAEVMRYIGRGPRTEEESRRNLDWLLAHGERLPFGYWVLRDRAGGDRLGGAVLMIRREGAPVELGFMLARPAWGRGLATQVAQALVRYAFGDLRLAELQAFTAVDNAASAAVLRKAGLRDAGLCPGPYGGTDRRFEIGREEWLASRAPKAGAR